MSGLALRAAPRLAPRLPECRKAGFDIAHSCWWDRAIVCPRICRAVDIVGAAAVAWSVAHPPLVSAEAERSSYCRPGSCALSRCNRGHITHGIGQLAHHFPGTIGRLDKES